MGMLKGNSGSLDFSQLMAQATQVTKKQDAALMERARQKLREDEDRRKREARAAREKEAAEQARRLQQQQQQRKKPHAEPPKRQSKSTPELERRKNGSTTTKGRNVNNSTKRFSTPASSFLPEKKKPVHMSFADLMKTAKEQSLNKPAPAPTKSRSVEKPTPRETLYHRQKKPTTSLHTSPSDQVSARERARMMGAEVPKKVNRVKKDQRSISEIQREIRHAKGHHSDEDEPHRKDARLMSNTSSSSRPPQRYQSNNTPLPRRRQPSPQPRPLVKRPAIPAQQRSAAPPPRRMPFSGRPLGSRGGPPQQNRRRYEEEEEIDDELADFVVEDDEDDDDRYSRNNGYSDEISKIFRYDKNKYANEPVYSDDDMEANTRDVLNEEKRSERIARREDLIEEQKEMERLKKRKRTAA